MPVSFSPASHPVESVRLHGDPVQCTTPLDILQQTSALHARKCEKILQSTFDDGDSGLVIGRPNGLVMTLAEAYGNHHAVSIRPDDVWIAILAQFSAFINANAENSRFSFVTDEGQKELKVFLKSPPDYGALAVQMARKIHENVTDPALANWILPNFSTTKPNDTIVSSVVMMGTLKKNFAYSFKATCGIPRVTLEGKRRDWVLLVHRIEKLKEYGAETTAWYHLLRPVLVRFVRAFDEPDSKRNLDFWQKVVCFKWFKCESPHFSGWLTAFCTFDADGRFIGDQRMLQIPRPNVSKNNSEGLTLDGAIFHRVDIIWIPPCYTDVEITIETDGGGNHKALVVAGMVGYQVCDGGLSRNRKHDLLKPVAGWFFLEREQGNLRYQGISDIGWFKHEIDKQFGSDAESATDVDLSIRQFTLSKVKKHGREYMSKNGHWKYLGWLRKLFSG
ncbi:hypothetical protein VKT23_008424 [Stygiomarasmius scandens]|uniref:Uncharacterized protein n=1 Tax=Marasmiellus scandens TaxID=2682957 RepID=A0ABR1JMG1_9AGAR